MKKNILILLTVLLGLTFLSSTAFTDDYKKYERTNKQKEYFEISFNNEDFTIITFEDETDTRFKYLRSSVEYIDGEVFAGGKLLFNSEGLSFNGRIYEYSEITDTHINEKDGKIRITFLTSEDKTRTSRFKKGNNITFDENITLKENDFVRGVVFSVTGDIEIFGEVNKDVVSLLGDIYIGSEAIVRGDVASAKGRVKTSKNANVYGEINQISKKRVKRKALRFSRRHDNFEITSQSDYNRVDGLYFGSGFQYDDRDSLLPRFHGTIGYAFESERWRYDVGIEQTLFRELSLSVGGSFYRELYSEDDWIIGNNENSIFALFFTEDYKDYYEAEGARGYFKIQPAEHLSFETGINYRETKFLRAYRHIWSLFGGSKIFRENFSTVEEPMRSSLIAGLDSNDNSSWYNIIEYSNYSKRHPFNNSGWHLRFEHEWSSDNLNSDYDYKRYMINIRRYQVINHYTTLMLRGVYGGSDGYLPYEKRFYLGGLGTLRGYDNKELIGTEFWMANSEYRLNFPGSSISLSVFWDVAQVANDVDLNSGVEVKNSVGISFYIDDSFNVSLAKRLDRSYDDNLLFYARFKHNF